LIRGLPGKRIGKYSFFFRKSSLCLVMLGACAMLMGLMFTHAAVQRQADGPFLDHMAGVVKSLEHPVSLEHFPTGSIAGPPAGFRRLNGKLD
jgi:hypothetical protein